MLLRRRLTASRRDDPLETFRSSERRVELRREKLIVLNVRIESASALPFRSFRRRENSPGSMKNPRDLSSTQPTCCIVIRRYASRIRRHRGYLLC